MAAGTPYSQRYVGGFKDYPDTSTPADKQWANAVEAALKQLYGQAPTVDGQVPTWVDAQTQFGFAKILDKNVDPAAAIAWSKLATAGAIHDADVASGAAIARSKLNFGSGLIDADIAAAAALAISKLANFPNDVTKGLAGDGTWPFFGKSYIKTTSKAVNTSVSPTDLCNGEITLDAGIMGTNRRLYATLWGDYLTNVGLNSTGPRFQLVVGGTTVFDTGVLGVYGNQNASRQPWSYSMECLELGGTATQVWRIMGGYNILSGSGTPTVVLFVTGLGSTAGTPSAATQIFGWGINNTTIDTTASLSFVFNVINGVNNVAYETRLLGAHVRVSP